ncbi:response regulator [Sinorhizobium meliloti]|uniref:response regulator n=1 Tax=Rhizobium meliloti TaxID=382 RepID=UPI001F4074B2|nr:response regulator [Sinorhizobium meliloti]
MDFEDGLREAGFMVLAVTSGKKAIEHLKAAESSIAGIVTDIRFAEFPSGWDVARIAREVGPEMPVVYISGDGAPDWTPQCVPKSMIEKPFVISQLIVAISPSPSASLPRGGLLLFPRTILQVDRVKRYNRYSLSPPPSP